MDDAKLPPVDSSKPNLISIKSVCEKDFGCYRCEVKEAGKVVLTVYRALCRDETILNSIEASATGTCSFCIIVAPIFYCTFCTVHDSQGGIRSVLGKRIQLSVDEESNAKRSKTRSLSGTYIAALLNSCSNNYIAVLVNSYSHVLQCLVNSYSHMLQC